MNKAMAWFKNLSRAAQTAVVIAGTVGGLATVGAISQPASQGQTIPAHAAVITSKIETSSEAIPFATKTIDDPTLDIGTTKVQTEGTDGVLTHSVKIIYADGKETSRVAQPDVVSKQAVDKVIANGTHQPALDCPNGSYVNSAGTSVCSPYAAPSTPAGATAQCVDGTYSFSQSRSGTCSHHGGVAVWL